MMDGGRLFFFKRRGEKYIYRLLRLIKFADQILENVWGYNYIGDTNVVDVYIRYLRNKIDQPFQDKLIYTIRGIGYQLKEN